MYGYICYYANSRFLCRANNEKDARKAAASHFGIRKRSLITLVVTSPANVPDEFEEAA